MYMPQVHICYATEICIDQLVAAMEQPQLEYTGHFLCLQIKMWAPHLSILIMADFLKENDSVICVLIYNTTLLTTLVNS